MRKRLASSKIAKELIACVIIASGFVLVMNRVIGSTHDLLSVISNMQIKVSIVAEIGILKGSGGAAPLGAAQTAYKIGRARSFAALDGKFGLKTVEEMFEPKGKVKMRAEFVIAGLRKRLASSMLAKELIACVIIASGFVLVMNRVIGSTCCLSV